MTLFKLPPIHLLALLLTQLGLPVFAQPTSNPVEDLYGSGMYDWSAAIDWDQVVNIQDYGAIADGSTPNDTAYANARDALGHMGGGVVYFPSGTYFFADNIALKDNVVLRGETPTVADATNADFRPPSRLVFPKFVFDKTANGGNGTDSTTAFKSIGMASGQSGINTGVVFLDIDRAGLFAGGYGTSSENVIVLGVRSNNVAEKQPWTIPTASQHPWQIHPNRFAANISAFAYKNVLVANNRLNDKHYWVHRQKDGKDLAGAPADMAQLTIDDFHQEGYLIKSNGNWRSVEDIFSGTIPDAVYIFNYTDHYGINVQGSTGEWGAPPWVQPNLFYAGAVIRDNWVYSTMRVKIDGSGRGLVIKDNILLDRQGKRRFVSPNGDEVDQNSATLENRGIDWRGHEVLIEGNEIEVFRHLLGFGNYMSVDGEGILHQEVHGSTIDHLVIRNNSANAYIGIWKMPYTRNVLIEGNTLTGPGNIYIQSDTNGTDFPLFNVVVRNNVVENSGILIKADLYSPGALSANVYNNKLAGTLEIEDHALHASNFKLDGTTPATVDTKTGAQALEDFPAEGVFFASEDPDSASPGSTINFKVLVTTPSVNVKAVEFYRHKTLMAVDTSPPYNYSYTSDGSSALWSAKIEQPEQSVGMNLYTALLLEDAPDFASPPQVSLTSPDPSATYAEPVDLTLEADVIPGAGDITKVEFYAEGNFLGADTDALAPYSILVEDVTIGVYSLTAKVWDADGSIAVSAPILLNVEGPPDATPSNLTATPFSDTEIYLSWVNNATNAEGFRIEVSPTGQDSWIEAGSEAVPNSETIVADLEASTTYDFRVSAFNQHGSTEPGTTATATTFAPASSAPGAPTGFKGRALNADRINLDWLAVDGSTFGYVIEFRYNSDAVWSVLANLPAQFTSVTHDGLTAATQVQYRIMAWNNAGNSAWVETSAASLTEVFEETFSENGDPWPIPGLIKAADYNINGYYDTDSGNNGGSNYRSSDDVDLGGSGSESTIGWIENGEWLDYSVIVEEAGLYSVDIGFSSPNTTGSLSLRMDGELITPAVVFPNTGEWSNWDVLTITGVYLQAGHYTLRVFMENSGFNLDHIKFTLQSPADYTSWSTSYLSGSSKSAASENADNDPYTNVFEMLFGLDPNNVDESVITLEPPTDFQNGKLLFPIAKGHSSMSWNLEYTNDISDSDSWIKVPFEDFIITTEEPGRFWYKAELPTFGSDDAQFFRFMAFP